MLKIARALVSEREGSLSASAEAALLAHPFPGNVRELKNLVARALAFADGDVLGAEDLDLLPRSVVISSSPLADAAPSSVLSLEELLQAFESHYLALALTRGGSQREAGRLLQLDRFAVARRSKNARRLGGPEAVQLLFETLPPWAQASVLERLGPLPEEGLSLQVKRASLESELIARALEETSGNRAQAASILGMSRSSLGRRLDSHGQP